MAVVVGGTTVTGTQTLLASVLTGTASAINGSNITNIAGGKIKQVVNATGGSELMTSSTINSTGLHVTITPSASTSKLLVIASTPRIYNNGTEGLLAKIYQGTSGEGSGSAVQSLYSDGAGYSGTTYSPATMTAHIPASNVTTDDHTFTVMHANDNNSTLVGWFESATGFGSGQITVMEILA